LCHMQNALSTRNGQLTGYATGAVAGEAEARL